MRVLCIGDIVGKPGRQALRQLLPDVIKNQQVDLVIANGENASGGVGITASTAKDLLALPIDVLTAGNHVWKYKDILPFLEKEPRLVRPLNYPAGAPGQGCGVFTSGSGVRVGVVNVLGRAFMDPVPCPFAAAQEAVARLKQETPVVLVEVHAEATSEKRALGWFLAGQASAVYGTHTHVATADEEILGGGTGYITDIGMTGPYDSVIGMRKDDVIRRMMTVRPAPMVVAKRDVRLCGVLFDIDEKTGQTQDVQRVKEHLVE